MASDWSVIRGEIEATLEAAPLSLLRVKRGISELNGQGVSGAGRALYKNGYLVAPRSMRHGARLERLSVEREISFEVYTGTLITDDYDEGTDALIDRCEMIIQKLRDCNANIPHAWLCDLEGDVRYLENPDEPSQILAVLPFRAIYVMA